MATSDSANTLNTQGLIDTLIQLFSEEENNNTSVAMLITCCTKLKTALGAVSLRLNHRQLIDTMLRGQIKKIADEQLLFTHTKNRDLETAIRQGVVHFVTESPQGSLCNGEFYALKKDKLFSLYIVRKETLETLIEDVRIDSDTKNTHQTLLSVIRRQYSTIARRYYELPTEGAIPDSIAIPVSSVLLYKTGIILSTVLMLIAMIVTLTLLLIPALSPIILFSIALPILVVSLAVFIFSSVNNEHYTHYSAIQLLLDDVKKAVDAVARDIFQPQKTLLIANKKERPIEFEYRSSIDPSKDITITVDVKSKRQDPKNSDLSFYFVTYKNPLMNWQYSGEVPVCKSKSAEDNAIYIMDSSQYSPEEKESIQLAFAHEIEMYADEFRDYIELSLLGTPPCKRAITESQNKTPLSELNPF